MPGGIDPHTHLDMPFMGTNSADNYDSGTRAALSGGTTMVVDFCIPGRGQPLMDAINAWDKRAELATTDYSYHMCITYWSDKVAEDMEKVVDHGVTTFKHFMAYKGALMVNDEEMFASFSRCAELGAMPLVHAENGDLVAALQKHYLAKGVTGPEGHALSRPPEVEGEATNRAIILADQAGVPLYIVHTSCIEAHEAIRRARQNGMRVYGEPLIQHLVLDESEYYNKDWAHSARRVMSPPFRDKKNQDDLWNGLRAGSLQVVATDHCAFTTKQKEYGRDDFTKIPNGTGGLEDRMPVLWTYGVGTGRLTAERIRRGDVDQHRPHPQSLSAQGRDPARRRRRSRRLGPEGAEDDHRRQPGLGDRLQRVRGRQGTGLPRYTLSRGSVVFEDGKVLANNGRGRFVKREPFAAEARALAKYKALTAPKGSRADMADAADAAANASSRSTGLSLTFQTSDGPVQALSGVDLQIARGEFVSFIGPSGCGKTTLLRAVADLETPTSGTIRVNGMSPHEARVKRAYGYVFQAPALYPWRSVARNIALPLEIMGIGKAERAKRVAKGLELVNLTGFGNKFPWQLSGGMQQRASIARALSFDPDLLLMDEPFGALDEIVRDMLNQQLLRAVGQDRQDGAVRHPFDSRGGVSVDPHRRDVAAAGPHPRRHRMRFPARPHARHPRDAGVSGGRQSRATRSARGAFL